MTDSKYTSHPSGVDCIEIAEWMPFNIGCAVKNLYQRTKRGRASKNLEVAAWYIEREIARTAVREHALMRPRAAVDKFCAAEPNTVIATAMLRVTSAPFEETAEERMTDLRMALDLIKGELKRLAAMRRFQNASRSRRTKNGPEAQARKVGKATRKLVSPRRPAQESKA